MKKNSMNVKLSMVATAMLVMLPNSQGQTVYASLYEHPSVSSAVKADIPEKDESKEQVNNDLQSNKNYWVDFLDETLKNENLENVPEIEKNTSDSFQDKDYWANYVENAVDAELTSSTQNEKSEFQKMKTDKTYWADYLNNVQE